MMVGTGESGLEGLYPARKGCIRPVWRDGWHGRIRSGRVVAGQEGL